MGEETFVINLLIGAPIGLAIAGLVVVACWLLDGRGR
jgi:hypothetical protein